MKVEVVDIVPRTNNDPVYADYWLVLRYTNYNSVECAYISWEVPLTRVELDSIKNKLPKKIREKIEP